MTTFTKLSVVAAAVAVSVVVAAIANGAGGRPVAAAAKPAVSTEPASKATYMASVTGLMKQTWPRNRVINIVAHGHSVPAGYFQTPKVDTFNAYPYLLHVGLKERYPFAVMNVIVTAIGGEQAEQGAARFERDVLNHNPDVILIDYGLNDRAIGLARAEKAWSSMIEKTQAWGKEHGKDVKVILLTPTGDGRVDINNDKDDLAQHAAQIRRLAAKYKVGLVDSYAAFKEYVNADPSHKLADLMSMYVHPNRKGHDIVANKLLEWFPQ